MKAFIFEFHFMINIPSDPGRTVFFALTVVCYSNVIGFIFAWFESWPVQPIIHG